MRKMKGKKLFASFLSLVLMLTMIMGGTMNTTVANAYGGSSSAQATETIYVVSDSGDYYYVSETTTVTRNNFV